MHKGNILRCISFDMHYQYIILLTSCQYQSIIAIHCFYRTSQGILPYYVFDACIGVVTTHWITCFVFQTLVICAMNRKVQLPCWCSRNFLLEMTSWIRNQSVLASSQMKTINTRWPCPVLTPSTIHLVLNIISCWHWGGGGV